MAIRYKEHFDPGRGKRKEVIIDLLENDFREAFVCRCCELVDHEGSSEGRGVAQGQHLQSWCCPTHSRAGAVQPIPALAGIGPSPSLRAGGLMSLRAPHNHILQKKGVVVGDSIIQGVDSSLCTQKGFSHGVLPAWCPSRRYPGVGSQAPGQSREGSSGHGPRWEQWHR